jgi:hypothetical protein
VRLSQYKRLEVLGELVMLWWGKNELKKGPANT